MTIPPLIDKVQGADLTAPQGGGVRPITITFRAIGKKGHVFDPTDDATQIASILILKIPSATLHETLRILDHYVHHAYPDLTARVPQSPYSLRQLDLFLDRE